MKKREEIEMNVYEKLGIRKLIKISNKLDQLAKKVVIALTPKSKKEAKKEKLEYCRRFFPDERVEGLLRFQKNASFNTKSGLLFAAIYVLGALIYLQYAPLAYSIVFAVGIALGLSSAAINRYGRLKAKKIEEKWHKKYENQKEDVINDIMTTNKKLGHPQVEIINKNNRLKQTSLCEVTRNAELLELQGYNNYLNFYAEAYQNNEPLPVMDYSKEDGAVLRLVPNYAKKNR